MKKYSIVSIVLALLFSLQAHAQECKTTADLDAAPGKYLTAAQYPWPAVRTEYFSKMNTAADKALAKQTLAQIEKIEQESHAGFSLTGGNWENIYASEGYQYLANAKLGQYNFQAALFEYFCANGKSRRNDEYNTVLRIYVNKLPLNTLNRFFSSPFGSSFNYYDFGMQFADWKNHQSADVNAKLIDLFTYLTCNNTSLLESINTGNGYFQDVPEKDIKPNNNSNQIYRYWFITKGTTPLLVPVTRKEYLQSLLEYYEREKLHFAKLVAKLKEDHDNSLKNYNNWEAAVADKIAIVKKTRDEHDEEWLAAQAIINPMADNDKSYKAQLPEQTNINRFWQFYDKENKSQPLYKYNPAYFTAPKTGAAKPQFMTLAFRHSTMPRQLRVFDNFNKNFNFGALRKMLD